MHTTISKKIINPNFDFKQSSRLRACIEIDHGLIRTALFTEQHQPVYLQHHSCSLAEKEHDMWGRLTKTEAFFSQTYAQVYVGLLQNTYTLVPKALYQVQHRQEWLSFNHPIEKDTLCFSDSLYANDSCCVYAIDEKLKEKIDKSFPNNQIKHKTSYLSESLSALSSKKNKTCLVHVQHNSFDVILYDKKMIFFNSFSYETQEDFLYFILAAWEQNHFLLQETELVLSGAIEAQSDLHQFLKSYIPKIKFAVTHSSILLQDDFKELPNHFYYSLFNLYLCAL
ncbi:MAG: DUF3822 family protein [Bacteroidetes bacterium]|nr:DUF3822 family protein [Bacteroidota bacterium]